MKTAQHIASVSDSLEHDYHWISSTQVLLLRHVYRPYPPDYRMAAIDREKPLPSGHYQAFVLETDVSREKPLEAFNARYAPLVESLPGYLSCVGYPGYAVTFHPPPNLLSPDGKWLLWHRNNRSAASSEWIACTLDGSQQQTWQTHSEPGQALWTREGSSWMELEMRYEKRKYTFSHALLRDCSHPHALETWNLKSIKDGLVLGMTSSYNLLICRSQRHQKTSHVYFEEVVLSSGSGTAQQRTVSLPSEAEVMEVSLSPQGNSLAWVLGERRQNPSLYTLWISLLDGSEMYPLIQHEGVVEKSKTNMTGQSYFWPRHLRWLPEGDQLSYLYHHSLWKVAAI